MKHKNDLTELSQLAEQVIECFNTAAAVIEASNLDPEEAKEYRRLWANVYSSACDALSKIGETFPELDPYSLQRIRERIESKQSKRSGIVD